LTICDLLLTIEQNILWLRLTRAELRVVKVQDILGLTGPEPALSGLKPAGVDEKL